MNRHALTLMTAFAAATIGAVACGSSSPTAPATTTTTTTPPATAATVTAVTVSGPTSSTTSFQLTAMAKYSDGTSQDVTSTAKWDSSDPTIASIATTGMVTVVGNGVVTLKATYQNQIGSIQTQVSRPRFKLSGTVWEVAPNQRAIAGARVVISGGPDGGASVLTDANGAYVFPSVTAGLVSILALKDGYVVATPEGVTVSGDTSADVFLVPTPPQDANGNTATARCVDGTWSWATTRDQACAANGGIEYPVCPGVLCPNTSRR